MTAVLLQHWFSPHLLSGSAVLEAVTGKHLIMQKPAPTGLRTGINTLIVNQLACKPAYWAKINIMIKAQILLYFCGMFFLNFFRDD